MPTMPNLIGLQYQNALAAMVAAGVRAVPLGYFQVDPVTTNWLKAVAARPGFVIDQSVAAGQNLAPNAPVMLTVASHPMGVSGDTPVQTSPLVPDLVFDQPNSGFILDQSVIK